MKKIEDKIKVRFLKTLAHENQLCHVDISATKEDIHSVCQYINNTMLSPKSIIQHEETPYLQPQPAIDDTSAITVNQGALNPSSSAIDKVLQEGNVGPVDNELTCVHNEIL